MVDCVNKFSLLGLVINDMPKRSKGSYKRMDYKGGLMKNFIGKGVSRPTHTQGTFKLLGKLLFKGRVQIRDNG